MAHHQMLSLNQEQYVKEMAETLKTMADEKEITDVIILCGEKRFPVHKAVLAGQSSYFRTMFRNICKETLDNVVELPTINENTFTIILDFIYSFGFTQICWKNVEETVEVLEAAHLFELKPLFSICCQQLVKDLTLENCLKFWKLSNLYQNEIFRSQCLKFIKNNLGELVKADVFLGMDASDFKLLVTQMKVAMQPQEYFMNSVSEWILENRAEGQSLIPLLNINNLSKKIIKLFLEKNSLSEVNTKFLEQLCETDWQTEQYEKSVELDFPLSSLKILLYGEVDERGAFQIVDFSGRSSELKYIPIDRYDMLQDRSTVVAVYKTKLYILTMEKTKSVPFYECCLVSGKIFLRQPMDNEYDYWWGWVKLGIVFEGYFYVCGCWERAHVFKPFLKRYDISSDIWLDLTQSVENFSDVIFGMKIENGLLLIGKNTENEYAFKTIDKNGTTDVFRKLQLSDYFQLKTAFCYNNELFLISNERLIVHNLIDNTTELRFDLYKPKSLVYFSDCHSFTCAVETNDFYSQDKEWSHRLVNFTNGQVITKILVQPNLFSRYRQAAFVSDIPIGV